MVATKLIPAKVAITLAISSAPAAAQFLVTPETDPVVLFDNLSGGSISLVGTPTYVGGPTSSGIFTGGLEAGLDFDSGVIFSTGNAVDATGPNNSSGKGSNLNLPGDPDLAAITGQTSLDASGLTFSFTTVTGDLYFNFMFASEEYEEYINSSYNDVFAFLLTPDTDPNTPGNQPGNTLNLALIKGTSDPISVDTVNPDNNASSYISNEDATENHQFDGRTTNVIASAKNIGAGEHIIKIVISDSGDAVLDSAVFLQAGTFGGQPGLVTNGLPVLATLRQSQLSMHQVGLRDVHSRLFRLRTRRPSPVITPSSDKGSYSAKGGGKAIIPCPAAMNRWQAFGSLHTYRENVDGAATRLPGSSLNIITLPDYEIDVYGGTAGVEYLYTPEWALGAAVIGNHADVDMGSLGDIESDGYALAAYASFYRKHAFNSPGDFYLDALYSYGVYDHHVTRTSIAGSATSNTESTNHTLALNSGYNLQHGSWTHGPFTSLTWTDGKLEGFTETGAGASTSPGTSHSSLLSRLGYQVSRQIQTPVGSLTPQFYTAWEHEFQNDVITVGGFPLSAPTEDRWVAGLGMAWNFSPGGRAYLNYEGRFGSDIDSHQLNLRVGFEF